MSAEEIDTFFEHHDTRGYKFDIDSRGNVFIVDMEKDEHASVVGQLQIYFGVPNGAIIDNRPIDVLGSSGKKNSFGCLVLLSVL